MYLFLEVGKIGTVKHFKHKSKVEMHLKCVPIAERFTVYVTYLEYKIVF